MSKIELLRGRFEFLLKAATAAEMIRAQLRLTQTEERLAEMMIVPFDEAAGVQFDHLLAAQDLRKIGRADTIIASIALAHRAVLVTRNLRHFRPVPGLVVENWVD